jgi:hypothetical protein
MRSSMSMTAMMALAAMALFGIAGTVDAADSMSDQGRQDQTEKQRPQDLQKDSELGIQEKSSSEETAKQGERQMGVGSMGEDSKGGAGPSGTKGLPPGNAPGFEGANKELGRAPTAGGR